MSPIATFPQFMPFPCGGCHCPGNGAANQPNLKPPRLRNIADGGWGAGSMMHAPNGLSTRVF